MWTLEDEEAYFYHGGSWLHECYYDFIYSMKEENIYGY